MRALLVFALLALLAAPALAGGEPRPRPWKKAGAILLNNRGVGFDRKPLTWAPDSNDELNIVSNLLRPELTWQLVGKAADGPSVGKESLYSVSWAFGAVVKTEVWGPENKLNVTLYGDTVVPIRPNKHLRLGPEVVISYEAERHHDRHVKIVVKNLGIEISIVQKYVKPVIRRFNKGTYSPFLTVSVTLTKKPLETLTGVLTDTVVVG